MRLAISFAMFVASAGCEHDGRVLVVVDTNFRVNAELGLVRASVVGSNGLTQSRDFVVSYYTPPPHEDPAAMPLSFLVVPRDAGSGDFEVTVSGHASTSPDVALVTRRAVTGFRPGRTLVLPLPLLTICRGVMCPLTQTCRDGACVDPRVPVDELEEVERPGEELPRDAGPPGSVDGGCAFASPLADLPDPGNAFDPTITADGALLVWTSTSGGLFYATRMESGLPFEVQGAVSIVGLVEPVAPAISGDGQWIVVEAKLTAASEPRVYELRRDGAAMRFIDPIDVFEGATGALHEPGTSEDGLRIVATVGGALVEGWRPARGMPFGDGRPLSELDAYGPVYPALSGDGLTIAFVTLTAGANEDIYLAHRPDFERPFVTPAETAGAIVNTSDDEDDPWLSTDARTLYFSREVKEMGGRFRLSGATTTCR